MRLLCFFLNFFFFKQKTAYEIKECDWSSDVCSSDLSDARQAAKKALTRALENAELTGALPELIWINSAPGKEEEIIVGLEEVVGTNVPIIGGSSADNTIEGNWLQFVNGKVVSDDIVLTVMFPSVKTANAFHSGYNPTTTTGTVTRAKDRVVFSIDGKPAAEVYNDWTNGVISDNLKTAGTILGKTTLFPIGRVVGEVQGVPYFRLSHPETITPERGLSFFTEIAEGDKIVLMEGSKESLVNRAGRVVKTAMDSSYFKIDEVSGALIIYCAGCMLAVQSEMDKVVEGINKTFPGKPFLGAFTFGEQGCLIGGENHHGNLMISTLSLGRQ